MLRFILWGDYCWLPPKLPRPCEPIRAFKNLPPVFSAVEALTAAVHTDKTSGARTINPNLGRLVQDMRNGQVERLVCYKLDRLRRSLPYLAVIEEYLTHLRIPLNCTSQAFDTSDGNPAGRLQLGVIMAVAEFEREIIRSRTLAGLAAARERGRKLSLPATLD